MSFSSEINEYLLDDCEEYIFRHARTPKGRYISKVTAEKLLPECENLDFSLKLLDILHAITLGDDEPGDELKAPVLRTIEDFNASGSIVARMPAYDLRGSPWVEFIEEKWISTEKFVLIPLNSLVTVQYDPRHVTLFTKPDYETIRTRVPEGKGHPSRVGLKAAFNFRLGMFLRGNHCDRHTISATMRQFGLSGVAKVNVSPSSDQPV